MSATSKIEWTQATWNPIVGCSIVSPGCTNCYAMKWAHARLDRPHNQFPHYRGTTKKSKAGAVWTGKIALAPEHILTAPLHWKKPRTIFVNSMGDLFHEAIPDDWIDRVFAVMALCPQHTFQVLTKRAARMRAYASDPETPFRVAKAMDAISAQGEMGPEEVRPIAGYPGYFASSHGHIYSEKRGRRRKMKPDPGEQGHLRVQLHRESKDDRRGDRLLVHRLILETFVGPAPAPDTQGRHRDGNPGHNAVSNLCWGDQEANWSDSKRHGTHRRYWKLTADEAAAIRQRHAARETGEALAREYEVTATQIRNIAAGKQWTVSAPIQWPLPNCWKGISAEDQERADERIPLLLQTPAAVRFVSAEPLLGPIDLKNLDGRDGAHGISAIWKGNAIGRPCLDWIIVGGESGPNARPMHPDWARSLRDQCASAGVAYFFKQWGDLAPQAPKTDVRFWRGSMLPKHVVAHDYAFMRVGKKAAGRLLDGREHNEFPLQREREAA